MENGNMQKRESHTVIKKVMMIFGLTFALIIPLSQVEDQIKSRSAVEGIAQKEVAKGWGGELTFSSPALVSTYDGTHYPVTSETNIDVVTKEKKRGVFQVPVYVATMKTTVKFQRPAKPRVDSSLEQKRSESDHLLISVKPISAVQSFKVREVTTGQELKAYLMRDGLWISVTETKEKSFFAQGLEVEISARGTGPLKYESNADQDHLKMTGNWTKPAFLDDILPADTTLSAKGFEATWALNALPNTVDGFRAIKSVGLNHLWLSTDYLMVQRAVKYGILFIALTFLLVFIVEFMSKIRIHPLQYGLIGFSISIFYLLLLAISENIGFHMAYFISSLAVTGLIAFYVHGFLNQKKFVRMILAEQVTLSTFFYVLLSLEEKSFLIGSIGLFIALAIVMIITRKFDWYGGSFKIQNADLQ